MCRERLDYSNKWLRDIFVRNNVFNENEASFEDKNSASKDNDVSSKSKKSPLKDKNHPAKYKKLPTKANRLPPNHNLEQLDFQQTFGIKIWSEKVCEKMWNSPRTNYFH